MPPARLLAARPGSTALHGTHARPRRSGRTATPVALPSGLGAGDGFPFGLGREVGLRGAQSRSPGAAGKGARRQQVPGRPQAGPTRRPRAAPVALNVASRKFVNVLKTPRTRCTELLAHRLALVCFTCGPTGRFFFQGGPGGREAGHLCPKPCGGLSRTPRTGPPGRGGSPRSRGCLRGVPRS